MDFRYYIFTQRFVNFNWKSEPESFPTLTVVAVTTAAFVVLGSVLLVYHKKHKRGLVAV